MRRTVADARAQRRPWHGGAVTLLRSLFLLAASCAPPASAPGGRGAGSDSTAPDDSADTATETDSAAPDDPDRLRVPVRFVPTDGGLTEDRAVAGLAWALTHLGAAPPPDPDTWLPSDGAARWLDLEAARLPQAAHHPAALALGPLRDSDEVAARGAIDAGRLLARTLHEPWWYYAITGACLNLEDWRAARGPGPAATYGVTESLLVDADRLIRFDPGPWSDLSQLSFEVETGAGVLDGSAAPLEVEVIDLMPSGQQRFALYGPDGALMPAADPVHVPAGQPGKCMWCHEGNLMSGTPDNPTTAPHASYADWIAALGGMTDTLTAHRAVTPAPFDWADPQVHTDAELLVREFLLPTPDRVARELGWTEGAVLASIEAGTLHAARDPEWPDRGPVLRRSQVDALMADYAPIAVLDDGRDAAPVLARGADRPPEVPAPACFSRAEAALGR